MNIQAFASLPEAERRRARLRSRPRGAYKRCQLDREGLLTHLRTKGIRTISRLRAAAALDPAAPGLYPYLKAFKSWREAKSEAFGRALFPLPERPTMDFIGKCILLHRLWTRDAYHEFHRRNPLLVPAVYWCERLFGCWENARLYAQSLSFDETVLAWIRLRNKLGRAPNQSELDAEGISLRCLSHIYRTKNERTEFLEHLARIAAERSK